MTEDEAVQRLSQLGNPRGDKESEHMDADDVLLAAASERVRAAYLNARDRADGWWYA